MALRRHDEWLHKASVRSRVLIIRARSLGLVWLHKAAGRSRVLITRARSLGLVGGRRQNLMLLFGAVVMISMLSTQYSSTPEQPPLYPLNQQRQSPLVCSHQLLNPPSFLPGQEDIHGNTATGVSPDGSLDAMTAFWVNGSVQCFDIDVVVLSDGNMLASHPRRLTAAIMDQRVGGKSKDEKFVLEELSLDSIRKTLGLSGEDNSASPFPIFDTEVLPHYKRMVRGIPVAQSSKSNALLQSPWDLKGPMLFIDLKQGPYLTEQRLMKLVKQIHALELEDYITICVSVIPPNSDSLDVLNILHRYNTKSAPKSIPLGLVLRDLVSEDTQIGLVRKTVEDYSESIKALIPSFKFAKDWYKEIRDPNGSNKNSIRSSKNVLWRLPMSVWTIDSKDDYQYVSSLTTTTKNSDGNDILVPMVSAVVANRPMEIIH